MTDSEKENIKQLIELLKSMYQILGSTSYADVSYGMNSIVAMVEYLSEELNNNMVEYKVLMKDISVRYRSMFPPKAGLGEFHIWDENYEIRHRANCEYKQVKKQIDDILGINKF